jgi:hypothetical protein
LEMSERHLCTTKTKLRKVLEFCDTDITARTLGETHVSTDDLTQLVRRQDRHEKRA